MTQGTGRTPLPPPGQGPPPRSWRGLIGAALVAVGVLIFIVLAVFACAPSNSGTTVVPSPTAPPGAVAPGVSAPAGTTGPPDAGTGSGAVPPPATADPPLPGAGLPGATTTSVKPSPGGTTVVPPTAVPAGSGGEADSGSFGSRLLLGIIGVVLLVGGAAALLRRSSR